MVFYLFKASANLCHVPTSAIAVGDTERMAGFHKTLSYYRKIRPANQISVMLVNSGFNGCVEESRRWIGK